MPRRMIDEMIYKAVKKTQHVPSDEKGQKTALARQNSRAAIGTHRNPIIKADDEFRGGDPVEMEIKKEEKELGKAQPGEESELTKSDLVAPSHGFNTPQNTKAWENYHTSAAAHLRSKVASSGSYGSGGISRTHLAMDHEVQASYLKKQGHSGVDATNQRRHSESLSLVDKTSQLPPMVKAQPGEEAGSFRGGDPEEIRIKREEKMTELAESGGLEDDGSAEDVTPDEIEEAAEVDKQKEEDKGKSIVGKAIQILSSDVLSGSEVSPVDTFGDYSPRDANGDLIEDKYANQGEEYRAPGPIRAGENQHKTWSEVVGTKVPMTGNPIQHLRRYWKQGQVGEMSKENELLARSLENATGLLWCWRPDFNGGEFYKGGIGSAPKSHHLYVKRWFEGGGWKYEYASGAHPGGNHGVSHIGKMGGSTMDVHPDFKGKTPEDAYNHSAHMSIAAGGEHPIKVFNKKTLRIEDRVLHMPGARKDKEGKTILDKNGMPDISYRGATQIRIPGSTKRSDPGNEALDGGVDKLSRKMTRQQVTTEKDVYGDDWMHIIPPASGKGPPRFIYDPGSRVNAKRRDVGKPQKKHSSSSMDKMREFVLKEKTLQERLKKESERGSVSPSERVSAKEWEPTHHDVWDVGNMQKQKHPETGEPLRAEMKTTNALERGDLGTWGWKDKDYVHTVTDPTTGKTHTRERHGPQINFDDHVQEHKVLEEIHKENYGPLMGQARKILSSASLLDKTDKKGTSDRINELINVGLSSAFRRAVNHYDPNHSSKARFSTYLVGQAAKEMQHYLPKMLDPSEASRAEALRVHSELTAQQDPTREGTYKRKPSQEREDQIRRLETEYNLTPRGEKATDGQRLRSQKEGGEVTVQPTTAGGRRQVQGIARESLSDAGAAGGGSPTTPEEALQQKQSDKKKQDKEAEQKKWDDILAQADMKVIDKSQVDLFRSAMDLLKADPDPAVDGESNGMKYLWREGEPGAHKHMWEDPKGNVVRGTNAPEGHPHHDPELGEPTVHDQEPTPKNAPQMFDNFGRKLHRSAPDGVETESNIGYDPDSNNWSQKYDDPETGNEEFISLHKDRTKNHRYIHNESIRMLDAQLEKIRQWYISLMQGGDMRGRAMGLAMALIDQAKMIADEEGSGLLSMRIKDVSMTGNLFKFSYKDAKGGKQSALVAMDSPSAAILHGLSQGKKSGDLLFDIDGQPIVQQELAQVLDQQFGVSLKQFRVYHGTEMFSKEFQMIVSNHPNLTHKDLHKLSDQASARVMRMLGHKKVDSSTAKKLYIDPIVMEALFVSAMHHHDEGINKAVMDLVKARSLQGRCVFQGLPVSIENRKGSVRNWYDPHNKQTGSTKMKHAYGYIRGTKGTDGDHVDVYLGPDKNANKVFVIHQNKAPDFKKFDEDKCMLGFSSGKAAKDAYMAQYDKPGFFGGMTSMPIEEFKEKVLATKKRPQMIKSGGDKCCSLCKEMWGKCSHSQEVEKSFSGSSDVGPVVWNVSVSHPERTPEEQAFGDWIHSHPMHEHDQHWSAFQQATGIESPPEPEHDREYAHGGDEPMEDDDSDWGMEPNHPPASAAVPEMGGDPLKSDEDLKNPEETAKSMISMMISAAG